MIFKPNKIAVPSGQKGLNIKIYILATGRYVSKSCKSEHMTNNINNTPFQIKKKTFKSVYN